MFSTGLKKEKRNSEIKNILFSDAKNQNTKKYLKGSNFQQLKSKKMVKNITGKNPKLELI